MQGAGLLLLLLGLVGVAASSNVSIDTCWAGAMQGKACLDFPRNVSGWSFTLRFDPPVDQLQAWSAETTKVGEGREWRLHNMFFNQLMHAGAHLCVYFQGRFSGDVRPSVQIVEEGPGQGGNSSRATPSPTPPSAAGLPTFLPATPPSPRTLLPGPGRLLPESPVCFSSGKLYTANEVWLETGKCYLCLLAGLRTEILTVQCPSYLLPNETSSKPTQPTTSTLIPPVIREISGVSNFTSGDNVTLMCHVTGSPPPTITWMFFSGMGRGIAKCSGPRCDIINVDASKAGLYVCHASNAAGNTSADVIVQLPESSPSITKFSGNTTVCVGDSVTLTCEAEGFPQPNITWEHVDAAGGKTVVGVGHTLTVSNLDPSSRGRYVCRASNIAGNASLSLYVTLQDESPVIWRVTADQHLLPGDNVTLSCDVRGVPPPLVTWRLLQNNGHVTTLGTGSTYDVISADVSKAGRYFCHASNEHGVTSAIVMVEVQDAADVLPAIIQAPQNVTARPGENVTLTCVAAGFPQPSVAWGHYDVTNFPEAMSQVPDVTVDAGGNLQVAHLSQQNAGRYVCRAVNSAGVATATALVALDTSGTSP